MGTHRFTFMGTAAGCGVPAFFCSCPACEEARANPALRRGDCGAMVRGSKTLLIDTPPDTRAQLLREDVRDVDEILFTHAHFDHIGGFGEMEYLVQLVHGGRRLPVYGSETALAQIAAEFHYMTYGYDFCDLAPFQTHEFDGVRYTGLPVSHAPGTFGYLLETPGTSLFYASDTAALPPETAERIRGVDVLAMDATYWGANGAPTAHHSVQECIEEGLALDAGTIYLTHMCMHYSTPITYAELMEHLAPYDGRVKPAMDGLTLEI